MTRDDAANRARISQQPDGNSEKCLKAIENKTKSLPSSGLSVLNFLEVNLGEEYRKAGIGAKWVGHGLNCQINQSVVVF